MQIQNTVRMTLAAGVVLITACTDSGSGENRLLYAGEALPVNEVKCLSTLKQMIVEFEGGTLRLSPTGSAPGFRAVLRFDDMARGNLTNRSQDGGETGGIDLALDSGASGRVEMMREAWVLDPERHPDVEPILVEVALYCPTG